MAARVAWSSDAAGSYRNRTTTLFAFKARATSLGRPAPAATAGCFGFAVFAVVDVVPVFVVVLVPVAVVLVAGGFAGAATLPASSPALVTRNVIARTRTPNAATI